MFKITLPMIRVSRIIQTTPEHLWDLLTDTKRWTEWGPSITAVQFKDRYIHAGATGRIKTVFGIWASFIVNDWEQGRYWSWRVFNIRATGHRIEITKAGDCRLVFEVPLWAAPYVIICRLAAGRIARCLETAYSRSIKALNND